MICALLLASSLSLWTHQFAQTPDSPKTDKSAAQEAPKPQVKRIKMATNIATSLLTHKVQPDYPQEAHDRKIQGTVRLVIIIGTNGKVTQAEVIAGHPLLAESALNAVRKWEYKPVLLNGEPVEVETTADVVFSLKH